MNSLLLSRITKDFLNLDPELVLSKNRYRIGWSGSVLATHNEARLQKRRAAEHLLSLRARFANLFYFNESPPVSLSTSPRLTLPPPPPPATYRPSRYFSRGALDSNRKRNPEPIPYLLIETNEIATARPVPGNSRLIRSLCKGKGILKRNKQGLVYLDIDNRFISMMLPYLKGNGLARPPYFNLFDSPDGAHIPVIPAREAAFHYLDQIEQLGQEFSFEIEGLYSSAPVSWPEVEEVWFFKLRSPELESLRRRYFLTARPQGHSFHIAVAIKPRVGASESLPAASLMRINIAFLAA